MLIYWKLILFYLDLQVFYKMALDMSVGVHKYKQLIIQTDE